MKRLLPRLLVITLIALALMSAFSVLAAGNTVPVTRLDDQSFTLTLDDLAPSACAGLGLTNLVTSSGLVFGTAGNDLILSGGSGDWIFAMGGDDCVVGGGGNDSIFGGVDTDVCIGGLGTDSFNQCETPIQ
ncbi:MAG: hypothetical protein IT310_07890 [Anaerolineales bacterium]|nr:hypothetical protein [Anaerolineales bacterium]